MIFSKCSSVFRICRRRLSAVRGGNVGLRLASCCPARPALSASAVVARNGFLPWGLVRSELCAFPYSASPRTRATRGGVSAFPLRSVFSFRRYRTVKNTKSFLKLKKLFVIRRRFGYFLAAKKSFTCSLGTTSHRHYLPDHVGIGDPAGECA